MTGATAPVTCDEELNKHEESVEMKQSLKTIMKLAVVLFSLFLWPIQTQAEDTEGLAFSMSIKKPENMANESLTYFDLNVEKNQQQALTVIVTNTSAKAVSVDVTPTNAWTNQNGVLDYSPHKELDPSLTYPFTSLISEAQVVEVPANASKEVEFSLKTPVDSFQGIILGAFVAKQKLTETKEKSTSGVKITNEFQLVKAVVLRGEVPRDKPELALNEVQAALVNYRTAVTANLQNNQPVMFGKLKVTAKIRKKGSSEILKIITTEGMEMAPNSNFDFPIMWGNQPLEPGDYHLDLEATTVADEWQFSKEFTITKAVSDKLNKEAIELKETNSWLYWIGGGLLFLLIVLGTVWIIKEKNRGTKKRKTKKRLKASRHQV